MPSSSLGSRERTTLTGVVVLFAVIGFAETAVSAVLPTAARDLGGIGSFGWLFAGFLAAKILGLVLAAQSSDRCGPRGPLVWGLVLFFVGLLVDGVAPTMGVLVTGRVCTGLGDGLALTAVYVVIGEVFEDDQTARVQSAIGSSFVIPTLAGPVVAGLVAQHLTWRLAFLGIGPFLLVAIALLWPSLRVDSPRQIRDVRRSTLPYAVAVAAAITAVQTVGQHPPPWLLLTAVAVPLSGLFVWGLRGVVPAGTFRLRYGVAAPIALRALYGGAFFGGSALVPLMMTLQQGYSVSVALPRSRWRPPTSPGRSGPGCGTARRRMTRRSTASGWCAWASPSPPAAWP